MSWPATLYNTEIDIIGVPYNFGQPKLGVSSGPKRIREAGLVQQIKNLGFKVHDKGDLKFEEFKDDPVVGNVRKPKSVGTANKQIANSVAESLRNGSVCLTLGGDHSMAIGSILGHTEVEPNIGVIWIDAHADINPPLASPSGNAHGMPLAFLVHELREYIPKDIPGFDWIKPCIHLKDITYIALRDLDEAEKDIIDKFQVKAFTMNDVTEFGIAKVVQMAINAISNCSTDANRPIHLSFDIDALDPNDAPSTGTTVPGGLSLREGVYITEHVAATGRLQVMDMAEVNPELGSEADQLVTLQSACEVIGAWFGKRSRKLLTPGYSIPRP
jgi:arginase